MTPTRRTRNPAQPAASSSDDGQPRVRLGLRENWAQFALLALVNLFVGGMVGLERTVTPLIGSQTFGLGFMAVAAFVVVFGLTKAVMNLAAGALTGRLRRKTLLVSGWLIAVPVPFMLAYGPSWTWVLAANLLLGVNQGLTWSMTVNMKIDLVGPARRGLALGINETAGYLGVAVTALVTGYLASSHGLRPVPELLGVGYVAAGLLLSLLAIRDTAPWARAEADQHQDAGPAVADPARADSGGAPGTASGTTAPSLREVAARVTWRDRQLAGATQAGLVNNFNDGLVWVVLPVLLATDGVGVGGIGWVKGLYPFIWGAGMLLTGHLADRVGRKIPIVVGMAAQALGLGVTVASPDHALSVALAGAFLLGGGTALVYPALLAAVTDAAHPSWRPNALGVYRFWRDSGYALGALVGGITAVTAGLTAAVVVAAAVTAVSAVLSAILLKADRPA